MFVIYHPIMNSVSGHIHTLRWKSSKSVAS